ncbi:MAG: hypothetical protein CL565_04015 [Alphaproteobacteria bacterium]|nr:hypothetical protein [Alphaproteobacteria bacterium]|tara:strand:+ start:1630 stop:2181 length:552 start_codon:yes stop_codon:yes gene_type:complete
MNILSRQGEALYSHNTENLRYALEQAIISGFDLSGASITQADLRNANLDGAILGNAFFSEVDFSGANMSECALDNAVFINCKFYDTCFAESSLRNAEFNNCNYGDTDFAYTCLDGIKVKTDRLSYFNFNSAESLSKASFVWRGKNIPMSTSPAIYQNAQDSMMVFDSHILCNGKIFKCKKVFS